MPARLEPAVPPLADSLPANTRTQLDAAVADLRARQAAWLEVTPRARAELISELIRDVASVADSWTTAAADAEGIPRNHADAAEEAIAGPYLALRQLRLLRRSLLDIERRGTPRIPGPVATRADGRVTAQVVPADTWDRLMYRQVTAKVWMQPGVTADEVQSTQAVAYRRPDGGGVCLVLGAGNVTSIGPLDVIYKLFVANRVVILKTHPTQAFMGPILEVALRSLVRDGWLRIVAGGAAEGAYLAHHPGVDELHITGSHRTYDANVFGTGPEGEARRQRDDPILDKPFTAELGNLTPIIIVPGPWSPAELEYQADNVATMLTNNAGFNCTTARVVITASGWKLRQPFLNAVRARLAATQVRRAYYPGAADRFDQFLAAHPEAELYGERADGRLPWAFITDLDPGARDEPCYTTEAFCGLCGETPLPSESPADFLDRAVAFANEALWGTLNATVIVHPKSLLDSETRAALGKAIANLRYGTVSVNHWSAIGFALGATPWGAHPGHPRNDIGSGTDVVHNTLMFSRVEKTVVRAPFRAWPKPIWFGTHRTARRLAPMLVRFEANPSLWRFASLLPLALLG